MKAVYNTIPANYEALEAYYGVPFPLASAPTSEQAELRRQVAVAAFELVQENDKRDLSGTERWCLWALGQRLQVWNRLGNKGPQDLPDMVSAHSPIADIKLRPQQQGPFNAIVQAGALLDKPQGRVPTLADRLTFPRSAILPTAFGKTLAMVLAAHRWGVGTATPRGEPMQGFVVTSRTDIKQQIAGSQNQGFGGFWPDLTVVDLTSGDRNIEDADVVTLTYAMLSRMTEKDVQRMLGRRSVGFFDEAHSLGGQKARERFGVLAQGRLLRGLTATPDYNDRRSAVRELLPPDVEIDLREGLAIGSVRSAELYMVPSGASFDATLRGDDYTTLALRELAEHEKRNDIIVRLVAEQVEGGRQGLVQCIPGRDENGLSCAHAYTLAQKLSGQTISIFDDEGNVTGMRPIVAKVVADGNRDNQLHKQEFEDGLADVLLYVGKLSEGYDSTRVGFMLYARPMRSELMFKQNFGRGGRLSDYYDECVHIQIVDSILYNLNSAPLSLFGLLGIDTIRRGWVVKETVAQEQGTSGDDSPESEKAQEMEVPAGDNQLTGDTDSQNPQAIDDAWPASRPQLRPQSKAGSTLRQLADRLHGKPTNMAYLGVAISSLELPPEGWQRLDAIKGNYSDHGAVSVLLNELAAPEKEMAYVFDHGKLQLFVAPLAVELLPDRGLPRISGNNCPVNNAVALTGIPLPRLKRMLQEKGSAVYKVFSADGQDIIYAISKKDLQFLLAAAAEREKQSASTMSLSELVREINVSLSAGHDAEPGGVSSWQLIHVLNKLGLPTESVLRTGGDLTVAGRRNPEDLIARSHAQLVKDAFCERPLPGDAVALDDLLPYLVHGYYSTVRLRQEFARLAGEAGAYYIRMGRPQSHRGFRYVRACDVEDLLTRVQCSWRPLSVPGSIEEFLDKYTLEYQKENDDQAKPATLDPGRTLADVGSQPVATPAMSPGNGPAHRPVTGVQSVGGSEKQQPAQEAKPTGWRHEFEELEAALLSGIKFEISGGRPLGINQTLTITREQVIESFYAKGLFSPSNTDVQKTQLARKFKDHVLNLIKTRGAIRLSQREIKGGRESVAYNAETVIDFIRQQISQSRQSQ